MASLPIVSVLVAVYNSESYLAACFDSILASTLQDFEIVVVDDGSTDRSVAVVESYATREPRIRFYRNEHNLGDYPNRNQAASLAQGKYLKYLDHDDLIYRHSLQVMVEAMERFPDAALGLSWNVVDPEIPYPFRSCPEEVHESHFLGRSHLGVGPSASIIRRDAFVAAGGFNGRQFIGDIELWLRMTSRWPMVSMPPALVWWRRHAGQQTAVEKMNPNALTARFLMQASWVTGESILSSDQRKIAEFRLRQHHARRILAVALRQRRPRLAWRLFRDSGLGFGELLWGLGGYR